MRSFLSVLGLYFASVAYAAIGPNANVFVGNTVVSPDGTPRSAVLAGGTSSGISFPGPLISGQKGDTFNLNVVNQLTDTSMLVSTSIHWHGLFQNGTAWADGPVGVTQCPIAPGNSFNYQFQALNQAGTYWYHSHYSTQYCDGLRGAFVLYDPQDPYASQYDVDDESTVITLADWYHTVAPVLGAQAGPPQSDAVLINGLGRNINNATAELAVITVEPGKRYRFRLVSISCDPNFQFSIDSHLLKIIEVDGNNVTPLIVDQIQIFAGQRYSFILVADQTPQTNYWIRALPNIGKTVSAGFTNGVNSAILRYSGAPDAEPAVPATVPTSKQPMVETALHPLEDPSAPGTKGVGNADVVLPLQINFTGGHFTVNNATFSPPSVPVLLQILSGTKTAQDLLPSGSVYTLPPNSIIEINLPGGTTGSPHPIHLHGHAFSVVRSAGNSTYNYDNPVRRDVVSIGTSLTDNVTIRFKTDNSGPWILHCHIDWHLELGLAVVMAEDVDTIAAHNVPPSAWDQLCPTYNALPTQTFN